MSNNFPNSGPGATALPAAQAQALAKTLFQQASAFHQKGQFEQAQSLYESLLRIQPGHLQGLQALANLAGQTHRYEMAIHLLSRAIAINPKSGKLHASLAAAYGELHRFEDALAAFEKAIVLEPNSAEMHHYRGDTLRNLHKPTEALASYDRAIAIKQNYAPAFNGRGAALIDLGQPDQALASLDTALSLEPDYGDAHNNRSAALNALGRFEEALASIDAALALKPNFAEAFYHRGNSLHGLARLREALSSYDRAIALKPYYPEAYYQRANTLRQLEQFAEAILSYDKAIALELDYAEARARRGEIPAEFKPESIEHTYAAYRPAKPARVHKIGVPPGFERHYTDYKYSASRFAEADIIAIDGHNVRVLERFIEPEIVVFENLLTAAECELLIDLSRPKLRPSPTFDRNSTSAKGILSNERTSEGAGFLRAENRFIRNIEIRLAKLMNLPFENGEEINILHYITGAEYLPHYDFFAPEDKSSAAFLQQAGQRVATLVMYLNDVEAGGETIFPALDLSVAPRKGGGVFFSYCDTSGKLDRLSLHGGAPVTAGEKWIATKWVRQRGYKVQ